MRGLRTLVRNYYSGTIERHGPTPLGVDWPNGASQYLRFVQLLKICDFSRSFSLNDFGCGYGALLEFLAMRHGEAEVAYQGIDISRAMVAAARQRWADRKHVKFAVGSRCGRVADYSLASGVFNVRLGHPVRDWEAYIESILADLHASSRIGFAVNFMLPRDAPPSESGLYRCEPRRWIDSLAKQAGGGVQLLGDYGLREFTLLIRMTPPTTARPQAGSGRAPRRSAR
ncbi:class I SAM-dependent methyltransferase [Bradyrhizobium sp.]|uniref:class I SAM-dependent methyltransferase n=1 Tax=Bradyrhizobium sp. TaxID=376 RepID=UPI003C75C199